MKRQSELSEGQWVKDHLSEENPEAVILEDLDDALIGVGRQHARKPVAVYSVAKILSELERVYDCTETDAAEWFGHNIECLGMGDDTPILLYEELV